VSFVKLMQPWLRTAAKHFVRHTIVTTSYRNAKGRLGALKRFSVYLAQVRPGIEPQAIDRSIMVAYLAHIHTLGMARATVGVWLVACVRSSSCARVRAGRRSPSGLSCTAKTFLGRNIRCRDSLRKTCCSK
jgi:hypothetical protein